MKLVNTKNLMISIFIGFGASVVLSIVQIGALFPDNYLSGIYIGTFVFFLWQAIFLSSVVLAMILLLKAFKEHYVKQLKISKIEITGFILLGLILLVTILAISGTMPHILAFSALCALVFFGSSIAAYIHSKSPLSVTFIFSGLAMLLWVLAFLLL